MATLPHGLSYKPGVLDDATKLLTPLWPNLSPLQASPAPRTEQPENNLVKESEDEILPDPTFCEASQSEKNWHGENTNTVGSLVEHSEVALSRELLRKHDLDYLYKDALEGDASGPIAGSAEIADSTSNGRRKRLRFTLGGPSPFPAVAVPSEEECVQVYELLTTKHGYMEMPADIPPPSQDVAGCGEVSFILDALIRTMISTHTHMSNADKAIRQVYETYRIFQSGDYSGSIDWEEVRSRGPSTLEMAIRPAGKSVKTSQAIAAILERVKQENDAIRRLIRIRRPIIMDKTSHLTRKDILTLSSLRRLEEDSAFLTLDYLHTAPPELIFERLQSFSGVGVKTAACLLLFCIQFPTLAVDTHVWRLSKSLGWVPTSASRDQTYFHVDRFVPNRLKYPLHQLFIQHGKYCQRCSGRGKESKTSSNEEICVLGHLVDPSRTKKTSSKLHKLDDMSDHVMDNQVVDLYGEQSYAGEIPKTTSITAEESQVVKSQANSKKRALKEIETTSDADKEESIKKHELSDGGLKGHYPELFPELMQNDATESKVKTIKINTGHAAPVNAGYVAPIGTSQTDPVIAAHHPPAITGHVAPVNATDPASASAPTEPAKKRRVKRLPVDLETGKEMGPKHPKNRYHPGNKVLSPNFTMLNPRRSHRTTALSKKVNYDESSQDYDDFGSDGDEEEVVTAMPRPADGELGGIEAHISENSGQNEPLKSGTQSVSDAQSDEPIIKEEPVVKGEPVVKEGPVGKEEPVVKEELVVKEEPVVKEEEIDDDNSLFLPHSD